MLLPTAFTTPKIKAPFALALSNATKVSAVSPLCEMAIITSPACITGFRYLNSEAYSTSTGMRAKVSIKYSANKPACQLVPQATMIIRGADKKAGRCCSIPLMIIFPSAANSLPRNPSKTVSGCSIISFSIKCSYPPFSMADSSISSRVI